MTFSDLRVKLKELKHVSDIYLNLFEEYHNTAEQARISGLDVKQNGDMWDVFFVDERGGKELGCRFYTEEDVCEYIYCYFKVISDNNRWF